MAIHPTQFQDTGARRPFYRTRHAAAAKAIPAKPRGFMTHEMVEAMAAMLIAPAIGLVAYFVMLPPWG
jgi:hypothetical protein